MFTLHDIEQQAGTAFGPTAGSFFPRKHPPLPEDPSRWLTRDGVCALLFEPANGLARIASLDDALTIIDVIKGLPRHRSKVDGRELPFAYGDQYASGTVSVGEGICILRLEVMAYDEGDDSSMLVLVAAELEAATLLVIAPHDRDPSTLLGPLPNLPVRFELERVALQNG